MRNLENLIKGPEKWFNRTPDRTPDRTPEQPETKPLSAEASLVRRLAEGLVEIYGVNANKNINQIFAELFHLANKTFNKNIYPGELCLKGLIKAIEAGDTEQVEAIITKLFNTEEQTTERQLAA